MKNKELQKLFHNLFKIDIQDIKYRDFDFEKKFEKKVFKLKGKEILNLLEKVIEILGMKNLTHYKNLKYNLKRYKRVHVNKSYVIIFYDDSTEKIYFVDYSHHDKVYKK